MFKRKFFSVAEKAEIKEKSKLFKRTKVDLAKSLGTHIPNYKPF